MAEYGTTTRTTGAQDIQSSSGPWKAMEYLLLSPSGGALTEASKLYSAGRNIDNRVAPLTPEMEYGAQGLAGMAIQNPLLGLGQEYFANTLGGSYLSPQANPYLSGMYQSAAEDITNQFAQQLGGVTSRFGQSGRTGSPGMMNALSGAYGQLGRSLGQAATDLYGRAYEAERGRQQQMAQFLPQMLQAEQGLYGGAIQGGQLYRDYAQQLRDAPYQNLQFFSNILQPYAGMGENKLVQTGPATETTVAPLNQIPQMEDTPWWETLLGVGGSLLGFL